MSGPTNGGLASQVGTTHERGFWRYAARKIFSLTSAALARTSSRWSRSSDRNSERISWSSSSLSVVTARSHSSRICSCLAGNTPTHAYNVIGSLHDGEAVRLFKISCMPCTRFTPFPESVPFRRIPTDQRRLAPAWVSPIRPFDRGAFFFVVVVVFGCPVIPSV